MIEIKNRWNGSIIYSGEYETLRDAVASAIANRADLSRANLSYANLSYANLSGADLSEANLSRANLSYADLSEANLCGAVLSNADLSYANLSGANLSEANLSGADLSEANLSRANLCGAVLSNADLSYADLSEANLSRANLSYAVLSYADLSYADLSGANLSEADLMPIRDDLWAVLSASPAEVSGLRDALLAGKIDGSAYEGDCACLVGTLAKVAYCRVTELPILKPDSSRPAERWFLAIHPGDTPDNSQAVKITLEWIDEWLANMRAAFGAEISK